jgi:DNA repair protein RadC
MRTLVEAMPLRDRPAWRAEFRPEHCNTAELLAAIVGGKSQMEIALGMVTRFGTLRALVVATTEEIMSVEGAGPATAARLRAALELGRRLGTEVDQDAPVVGSPDDAAAILIPRMQHLEQEHLVVLILDTRNRLIGEPAEIYRGSLNQTMVRVGELLRPAIRANGASIIVAHNHPSGDPTPSPEDVAITRAMVQAGQLVDVEVLDHLIIGRGRFMSMKSRGLGF